MKIGIIGSGIVAQTLAAGLVAHGHQVKLGTREPAKLAAFVAGHPGIQVDGVAQAAAFAELAILAVKGTGALEAARAAAAGLAGKTVIDTTNPMKDEPPVDGVIPTSPARTTRCWSSSSASSRRSASSRPSTASARPA